VCVSFSLYLRMVVNLNF